MQYEEITIALACAWERVSLRAWQVIKDGMPLGLAYHPSLRDPDAFVITHIRSGYLLSAHRYQGVPHVRTMLLALSQWDVPYTAAAPALFRLPSLPAYELSLAIDELYAQVLRAGQQGGFLPA